MIFGRTLVSIFILNEFGLLIIIYLRSTSARHVYFNSSFFFIKCLSFSEYYNNNFILSMIFENFYRTFLVSLVNSELWLQSTELKNIY